MSAKKVLVVDDEVHITALFSAILEINGFDVTVVSDGLQCLDQVEKEKPDIILLDVKMPRLDGWSVCKKLKSEEATKHIPIIIVTAFGQKEDRQKSLALGADDFLAKPFESTVLLERIEKFLSIS